ncbi:hypothetical protein D5018_14800 [Parashewanella curva]|uniref:Uncharacterized protein n=1 Tax=Parashewanella curva TaxID=2338552 RepID=A0A3L8PWD5_9GAMM|nr:hypothetical protein D5018_14800 [Parashewanella curva]
MFLAVSHFCCLFQNSGDRNGDRINLKLHKMPDKVNLSPLIEVSIMPLKLNDKQIKALNKLPRSKLSHLRIDFASRSAVFISEQR